MSTAPGFNESGYPNNGEQLRPAWQAIWDEMDGGGEFTASQLVEVTEPWIAASSTGNLLGKAWRCGLLRRRLVRNPRKHFIYRRKDITNSSSERPRNPDGQ